MLVKAYTVILPIHDRYQFDKAHRLRKSADFKRVFDARRNAADDTLVVFALPNGLKHCRLGVSISKKKCPKAVHRNRWKRIVRESFRLNQHHFPCNVDIVVTPQKGSGIGDSSGILLNKLVRRIAVKTMPTVLLTRPIDQAEPFKSELQSLGFCVFLQPTIEILPSPEFRSNAADMQEKLQHNEFDWLVFSSANGVRYFFDAVSAETNLPQIAVVGSGTAAALYHRTKRRADVIAKTFNAEGLAESFNHLAATDRFLLVTGSRGRTVLKDHLTFAGHAVMEVSVYQSVDVMQPDSDIAELLNRGKINYATVTSSAIGTALVKMFGEKLHKTQLVSISPLTSQTLRTLGYPPQFEAEEASIPDMMNVFRKIMDCAECKG